MMEGVAAENMFVRCPICAWRCKHLGSRRDGLGVSWRLPADQPLSGERNDRRFVRQWCAMRKHVKRHGNEGRSGIEMEQVKLAMAFIPSLRKQISRGTAAEIHSERKKRKRQMDIAKCRRQRQRKRAAREEEWCNQVPRISLREDLTSRNFDPVPTIISQQPAGARIHLYIADQPTPRTLQERWRETRLGRDAVRDFVFKAGHLVSGAGPDKEVLQHALSSLEVLYDLGQNVSLYALKKAVHISRGMTSAWGRQERASRWLSPLEPVLQWPTGPTAHSEAWKRHNRFFSQLSNSRAGDGGHHLTMGSQETLIAVLTRRRRRQRRFLEIGFGTGFLLCGLSATGAQCIGVELPDNSATVRNVMKEASNVVLFDMDGLQLTSKLLDKGQVTSMTCLIGMDDITTHTAKIFLESWFCTELAYLLPKSGGTSIRLMLEAANVELEQFSVTLSGGAGRSVVIARKRDRLSFA